MAYNMIEADTESGIGSTVEHKKINLYKYRFYTCSVVGVEYMCCIVLCAL